MLFKGGVVYQGTINVPASGTPGKPIVYEGTGWGTGQAILSGQTTASLTFTPYAGNPNLSVATLPTADGTPNLYSVVDIDGQRSWLSNTSTSTNPNFLDAGGTSFDTSEMTGSGTSWTLTDAGLAAQLKALDPTTIPGKILRVDGYPNWEYDLTITAFNPTTNAVSLSGSYSPATSASYVLFNDPAVVSASNPYSEFAVEGNQIIAAVSPGVHSVAVSTQTVGIVANNRSNVTIDGFNFTGYGGTLGMAVQAWTNPGTVESNVTITNNTISNTASHNDDPSISANGITNVTIAGNTIGPTSYQRAIGIDGDTNAVVSHNTITSPGGSGIFVVDDNGATVSYNSITNAIGVHAAGIAIYDANGLRDQNVTVSNNQINGAEFGITFGGQSISASQPNNLTIADNIVQNTTGWGIANWGYTNGANIYGNIVLPSPSSAYGPLALSSSSQNINWYDNILQ